MSGSRRRRKAARSQDGMPDWMSGEAGRQFVAVDVECRECGRHLIRARQFTHPNQQPAEPTWYQLVPEQLVEVPELGECAVLYCLTCSKQTGQRQRRIVPLADIRRALADIAEPHARTVRTIIV